MYHFRLRLFLLFALFGAALVFLACKPLGESDDPRSHPESRTLPSTYPNTPFGNPSNATDNPTNTDNFLIVGEGSVVSYNNSRGTPNWVSWRTTKADLGEKLERPEFQPDPRLPKGYWRISYSDYSGSGFDRGHLVPSADRFAEPRLNEETFFMTNVVPQTEALNQYPWNMLEMYVRTQVWRGFDAYQIAGVYGDKGRLKGKVTVPTNCWKIVVLLPKGTTPDQIDQRTRIIAVDMPNNDGIEEEPWDRYKTTIRAIEEKAGLDFFSALPRELQDSIETRIEMRNR